MKTNNKNEKEKSSFKNKALKETLNETKNENENMTSNKRLRNKRNFDVSDLKLIQFN